MRRYVVPALAMVMIVGTGVVHGMRIGRWQQSPAIAEAVSRLESIPAEVGDWQAEEASAGARPADVAGQICRRYVNRRTSETVTLFLVCGRPGPIAIHTPDVCYGARGFSMGDPKRFTAAEANFWTVDMVRTRATERSRLRAFWAWSNGGDWQAVDNPRLAFAAAPVLFKAYFIRELSGSNDAGLEHDPAADLMRELLPAMNGTLFPGTSTLDS